MSNLNPEDWVRNYGDDLYNWAFYKTSSEEVAQDLVQDTFFSALNSMHSFKGSSSEKTWLSSILKNKIIDYYRTKKDNESLETYLTDTEDSFRESFFDTGNMSGHWKKEKCPEEWAESEMNLLNNQEFYNTFLDCIDKLPAKLRNIIRQKFVENNSYKEICKDNDVNDSNYFVIIHRSKVILRACLSSNWFSNVRSI